MFQLVVAASIAFSAQSVDGIFKRSGSCSGGSCSAAPAKVESKPAKPSEAAAPKTESSCTSSCSSGVRTRVHKIFRCR